MSSERRMTYRMNTTTPTPDTRAQAEAWHARLGAADVSRREREAFERWHAQPGHAEAYAATGRLLDGVDALAGGDPRMEALMQEARRRPATLPTHSRRWGAWAVAACVVAALAMGLRYGPALMAGPEPLAHATAGEGRTLVLEDGSRVQLDVGSRITTRFTRRQRELELLEGRALFDVAHDAARPFLVRAGDGSVTALGTRFLVQRERNGVIVTLAEGEVDVVRVGEDGRQRKARLQPGEQLRWAGGDAWTLRATDTEAALGWTRGRLIFRSTPLAEVVAEVNRYSIRKLVLADPSLAELPVYGNFIAGDAGTVVAALDAVLPVRIEEAGQDFRIHRP